MIQRRYYKTVRVIVDSDGGGTPFYIENVDTVPGYFSLLKEGTLSYTPNLNYRIDNGEWFEYDVVNSPRIEVPVGSKIYLKGNNPNGFNQIVSSSNFYHLHFSESKTDTGAYYLKCNIGGYITSLLALENFNLISNIPNYSFNYFVQYEKVLSAEKLITSNITSVGNNGFKSCFYQCASLVTAPLFENVTSVEVGGFSSCFNSCTSLVTAPTFENVTSVYQQGFSSCFNKCTSLVTAPTFENLTNVGSNSFTQCFTNCSALVITPTFKNVTSCGSESFSSCFINCTSLETIIAPNPNKWSDSYFSNWVKNVPTVGTFYKKKGLEIPTGTNGIPEGWTVVEEA